MRRKLEPLANAPAPALLGSVPAMAVPATLRRLLNREEVGVATQLFATLSHASSRRTLGIGAVAELVDLSGSPNLALLLDERNTSFIAYLRFAPTPWRFREFMRMLCPAADERELDAFDAWHTLGQRQETVWRPASRSGLPALRGSKDLPGLRKPSKDCVRLTPRASCPELGVLRSARQEGDVLARPACNVTVRWRPSQQDSVPVQPPVLPPDSEAAVRIARRESADARDSLAKALPDGPVARVAADQIKRYVQQRYLELMMVDGMDPNAACARALREAPQRLEAVRTACT